MITFLIVIFAISNIYISVVERFKNYAGLIALQGVLLFGIALLELHKINILNSFFVITETLVFKGIVVPALLFRIIKRTHITHVHNKSLPSFYALLSIMAGLVLSIALSYFLYNPKINVVYFTIALFSLYTGLFLMVSHKKIFTHLIGFLVVENAVFMLSIALGSEMPMAINAAILLDIFVTILILGVFITKIGHKINTFEADQLTYLKH